MEIIISSNTSKPIYEQITSQMKAMIMSGELQTGDPIPSMRALAKSLHISVITVQKAYEDLHSILSLGAGGSTKMVDPVRDRIERVFHPKFPTEYIARPEKIRQDLETFRRFHENMQK